jgi:hypothetical protein
MTRDYSNIKIQLCTVDELDWWDELLNYDDNNEEVVAGSDHGSQNMTLDESGNQNNIQLPPIAIFILREYFMVLVGMMCVCVRACVRVSVLY